MQLAGPENVNVWYPVSIARYLIAMVITGYPHWFSLAMFDVVMSLRSGY
jgi:hypothetical protein